MGGLYYWKLNPIKCRCPDGAHKQVVFVIVNWIKYIYASVLEQLADLKLKVCLRSPWLRKIQENKPLEFLRMRLKKSAKEFICY